MPTPLVRDALLRSFQPRGIGYGTPSFSYSGAAIAHYCAKQTNRVLYIATVTTEATSSAPVSAVTVDGAAATKVAGTAYASGGVYASCLSLWRRIAPALRCEVSVTASIMTFVIVLDFYNVRQTTPNGTAVTQNSASITRSVNVTGALNDLVIDLVNTCSGWSALPSPDQIIITPSHPFIGYPMSCKQAVAGTNTMSWTDVDAYGGAMIGVAIKPA